MNCSGQWSDICSSVGHTPSHISSFPVLWLRGQSTITFCEVAVLASSPWTIHLRTLLWRESKVGFDAEKVVTLNSMSTNHWISARFTLPPLLRLTEWRIGKDLRVSRTQPLVGVTQHPILRSANLLFSKTASEETVLTEEFGKPTHRRISFF